MRDKLLTLFLFFIVIACSEEDLPGKIYGYQVERLLSGSSGSKTWSLITNSENCSDSLKLVFDLVANSSGDSLDISTVTGCNGSSTTSVIGRAKASTISGGILFTDSLNFSSGETWIVDQISSQTLLINSGSQVLSYVTLDQ